jgi:hypothetical protein
MGLAKTRLYKPDRAPARKRGVLYDKAPIGLVDARETEVAKALFALAREAGVDVGQGSGYDSLRDEYSVVGKSRATGKAQDFKIQGAEVASLIIFARQLNGNRVLDRDDKPKRAKQAHMR